MTKIERTITIDAPVEKVFSYVDDPTHLSEYWPRVTEVKDIQRLPNGGKRFRFVYSMAGVRFEGYSTYIEYVVNQRVVVETQGGIQSISTWSYQPTAGGTKLTVEYEYTIPISLLRKLAEAFILKINEHEADLLDANLKARMES